MSVYRAIRFPCQIGQAKGKATQTIFCVTKGNSVHGEDKEKGQESILEGHLTTQTLLYHQGEHTRTKRVPKEGQGYFPFPAVAALEGARLTHPHP